MKQYEYKFVEVPRARGAKAQNGDTFAACKQIITENAANGWRLQQVVTPFNEKTGIYSVTCYQIIFERERPAGREPSAE